MKRQAGRDKTAHKVWLSDREIKALSDNLSGEARIIFQVMVATGQRFSRIKKTTWDGLNAELSTLDFGGHNRRLPVATARALAELRKTATSGETPIFKMQYKQAWNQVSRAYFRAGIRQNAGCLKMAKLTYARRHFETYRNKSRLARDMGLTTARWIPKAVFQFSGPPACLVQF